MCLVERAAERRATMTAGAEAHELARITEVGLACVVLVLEPCRVDQQLLGSGLPGQWRKSHGIPRQRTGQGCTCQISLAYCSMQRSLENFPEAATFSIAL